MKIQKGIHHLGTKPILYLSYATFQTYFLIGPYL
jgi:hypothetical protein